MNFPSSRGSEIRATESFLRRLSATSLHRRSSRDTPLNQASLFPAYSLPTDLDDSQAPLPASPSHPPLDLYLTLLHTFIFTFFYYGSIPQSIDQVAALSLSPSLSGLINALTPLSACLSCFHYNHLSKTSYYKGYILSFSS